MQTANLTLRCCSRVACLLVVGFPVVGWLVPHGGDMVSKRGISSWQSTSFLEYIFDLIIILVCQQGCCNCVFISCGQPLCECDSCSDSGSQ